MSLRDDVLWLCDFADGVTIGWLPTWPGRWSTAYGNKLAWLIVILWRRYYDAAMARTTLEARVASLEGDVDGLRKANEILTNLLEARGK